MSRVNPLELSAAGGRNLVSQDRQADCMGRDAEAQHYSMKWLGLSERAADLGSGRGSSTKLQQADHCQELTGCWWLASSCVQLQSPALQAQGTVVWMHGGRLTVWRFTLLDAASYQCWATLERGVPYQNSGCLLEVRSATHQPDDPHGTECCVGQSQPLDGALSRSAAQACLCSLLAPFLGASHATQRPSLLGPA